MLKFREGPAGLRDPCRKVDPRLILVWPLAEKWATITGRFTCGVHGKCRWSFPTIAVNSIGYRFRCPSG